MHLLIIHCIYFCRLCFYKRSFVEELVLKTNHHSFIHSFIHSSIHPSMALQPFVGPWPLFHLRNLFTHMAGLLRRVISPSQDRSAAYTQDNTNTDIHAFNGIRTHDSSVRASEDSLCLKPRGHCDQ
jgi:hypothetical protein